VADVTAIHQNAAPVRIEITDQQVRKRGLAYTAGSENRVEAACGNLERNVIQHRRAVVAERNVFDSDGIPQRQQWRGA